jgi:enolase-phosphatase E1
MHLTGKPEVNVKAILTDIEGTTSSIDFVHQVLFPYASEKLPAFVREHQYDDEIAAILSDARADAEAPDAKADELIEIMLRWIAEDRKVTALKALQGHIWKHGYQNGDFTGHMYDDAVRYLRSWARHGIALYVYSSGSVAAQKLLFGHSDAGDLTPLFAAYFDTRIGHKREPRAYESIASRIGLSAQDILFLSDVAEELDAAANAGMQTIQLVRDDDVIVGRHPVAHDFGEIDL